TQISGTGNTTFGGAVDLAATTGNALDVTTVAVIVDAGVTSAGGDLLLTTDNIAIDTLAGSLDATATGIITIQNLSASRTINLGTDSAGSLSLTAAELNRLTAAVVRVGSSSSGDMTLSAAIAPTGTSVLHLISGAGLSGPGSVVISDLA